MKKNILVFPCGSEIGLEIFRSLQYSTHFNVIGANSVSDHGRFVYDNYIANLPYANDPEFIDSLNKIIDENNINLLYPTMDSVIATVASNANLINCQIISHPSQTTAICLSKLKTTAILSSHGIDMPVIYKRDNIPAFPVFLKPEVGYSARNTLIVFSEDDLNDHLKKHPDCLIMEYLPGEEFTVDCFTDKNRALLFSGARLRGRISNGISVNTLPADPNINEELSLIAQKINNKLHFRGAWFFQVKKADSGKYKVMEVAARLGGSSGLFRAKGVNFAELTIWDAIGKKVSILQNNYDIEMDRALSSSFKIQLSFRKVYVDFDDTILVNGKLNFELLAFLFKCKNDSISVICLSRHRGELNLQLLSLKISGLFDEVIHLKNNESKADFISGNSIFIDDSFEERKCVALNGISVFSPDMVSALLNNQI